MNKRISRKWKRLERRKRYLEWKGSKAYNLVVMAPIGIAGFQFLIAMIVWLIIDNDKVMLFSAGVFTACMIIFALIIISYACLPLQKRIYAEKLKKNVFKALGEQAGYEKTSVYPFHGIPKKMVKNAGLLEKNMQYSVEGRYGFCGTTQKTGIEVSFIQIRKNEKVIETYLLGKDKIQWMINGVFGILQTDVDCPCEIRIISSNLYSDASFCKKPQETKKHQPFQRCLQSAHITQFEVYDSTLKESALLYSDNDSIAKEFLTEEVLAGISNVLGKYDEVYLCYKGRKVYFYVNLGQNLFAEKEDCPEYMVAENSRMILDIVSDMKNNLLKTEESIMCSVLPSELGIADDFVDMELQKLAAMKRKEPLVTDSSKTSQ